MFLKFSFRQTIKWTEDLLLRMAVGLWDLCRKNKWGLILLLPLVQSLSIWNYQGDKVDESELVHFAVGFLGGDLDPKWYGYGSLGMYLLGIIYYLFGSLLIFIGDFTSMIEFGSSLFDSGFFFIVARLLFAFLGVMMVYIHYKTARNIGVPKFVLIPFLVVGTLGIDVLYFANYVRCDQLVAFFYSLMLYTLFFSPLSRNKKIYTTAILCAAATTSKIIAFPSFLIIPLYLFLKPGGFVGKLRLIALSSLVFVVSCSIFQPYNSFFAGLYNLYHLLTGFEEYLGFTYQTHEGFLEHLTAIFNIYVKFLSAPIIYSLLLLPFALIKYRNYVLVSLLILFVTIFPYFFHEQVIFYRFLPTFGILKILSFISIYSFLEKLIPSHVGKVNQWIFYLIAGYLAISSIQQYRAFAGDTLNRRTNKSMAIEWLHRNLLEESILLDAHYDHVMPRIFGREPSAEQKAISNAFIYNREGNVFLHQSFDEFIKRNTQNDRGFWQVKQVRVYDVREDVEERKQREGKYFVVSPVIYNRFLKNEGVRYSEDRLKQLDLFKKYYREQLSGTLVKKFDEGSGPSIEVYLLD